MPFVHSIGQLYTWLLLAGFGDLLYKSIAAVAARDDQKQVHLPWFHDAHSYWDFDEATNDTVLDFKQTKRSRISGLYHIVPGRREKALELSGRKSNLEVGYFAETCLSNPTDCDTGFTVTFWIHFGKVLHDGVVLQLGYSRGSRGITVTNTLNRNNEISLTTSVNTLLNINLVTATLAVDAWHHFAIVWQRSPQSLSVFVNCSMVGEQRRKRSTSKKGRAKILFLGANHSQKKSTPIIVDEFAIWLKYLERERLCQIVREEKVHGNYTSWSEFSSCSASCGPGTRFRRRHCTNPSPDYGGRNCSKLGPSHEIKPCDTYIPCPIAGGYTAWSNFTRCSLSCGGGKWYRNRTCSNPVPMYGGKNCSHIGEPLDVQDCNTYPCPIHGNYSPWTAFGPCSVSCGEGVQQRNRSCSNPAPRFGGRDCSVLGSPYHVKRCNLGACPINGAYTDWSDFSVCSKTCGKATKTRTRNCTNPTPRNGGMNCTGPNVHTIPCNNSPCPIDGNYSPWSVFTPCDKRCGNGTKARWRNCTHPRSRFGGRNCSGVGPAVERIPCNTFPCPVHGNFSEWSSFSECSSPCGNGTKSRTRNCTNPLPMYEGNDCSSLGPTINEVPCNTRPCPVHGNFSEWSSFSKCSSTCGNGTKRRTRNCTNPPPMHGGNDCSPIGSHVQIVPCDLKPCPIHGNFSEWSSFSECSSTCGSSIKTRTRNCTNPLPMHGGNDCSAVGPHVQVIICDVNPCPVHGNFSEWSNFSGCSSTCGDGTKSRTRNCSNPLPMYGGNDCSAIGSHIEVVSCYIRPCPIHGNFSEWSRYSECSSTCGHSTKKRTRNCTNPAPMYGGNNCSSLGADSQEVQCNVSPCPVHGNFSEWSVFTTCSASCGRGWRSRNRTCSNPMPLFGGDNCTAPRTETRPCFLRHCLINGNYTKWSEFTKCTKTCGSGRMTRYRYCTNPEPQYGGSNCSALGASKETIPCNTHPCPIHGNYSQWSEFGACSKSCENGTQVRRRFCSNPVPQYGGRDCKRLGDSIETRSCEVQDCPDIDLIVAFKLNDEEWNDELTNQSSKIFQALRLKVSSAIFGLHEKNVVRETKVLEFRQGSVVAEIEVIYFSRTFPGASVLHDALYSDKKLGSLDVTPLSFTSTDVPVASPSNFTAFNHSSTSLALHWSPVPSSASNGLIWGYKVTFTAVVRELNSAQKINHRMFANTTRGILGNLKEYSWYRLRISAMNKRGAGIPSPVIDVLTDEDVPNPSPNLKPFGYNTSSTSLKVNWRPIDQDDVNGILTGYCIFYTPIKYGGVYNHTTSQHTHIITLTGLQKHTGYLVRIAGITSKGVGGKSTGTVLYTDEDTPDAAPLFSSCRNESSTSILLTWHKIPRNEQNGIILNYRVYYKKSSVVQPKWKVIDNISADQTSHIVRNLAMFTNYSFRISSFTSKGEGVNSSDITVCTDEDVPSAPPSNVSAMNSSSTSIWLEWRHLASYLTRGILTGYVVFYKKQNDVNMAYQTIIVPPTSTELNITELRKFTVYNISLAALTSKGHGPLANYINVSTAEDVPSESPVSLKAFNTSSTSIKIAWKSIPYERIHGILLGYHILVRRQNQTEFKKKYTKSSKQLSLEIFGLLKYTKYVVKMVGFTSVGIGVQSEEVVVSTDQDAPSRTPEKLEARSKWSPTSIPLKWQTIRDEYYVHGVLLGYKIDVQLTKVAGEQLPYIAKRTLHIVGPMITTYELTGLEIYATYSIRVWAFTKIGDGPTSEVSAETCNCRSSFPTNWWSNSPYIYENSSEVVGIIPRIVPDIVTSCCGYCSANGTTSTVFENSTAPGVSVFRDNIDDNTELHFPMYGQLYQVKYAKRHEFIPLVESPGVVFLVMEDEEGLASQMLIKTLWSTLPLFLIMFVLIALSSILIWFADSISNPKEFPPDSIITGLYEGVWWSFISMTAVGYGDRCPRSALGRLVGVVWILIGVILTAIYTSTVTCNITREIVNTDLMLYGTKVAVIHDSAEHQLAVRKNAKVDSDHLYHNLDDVYKALTERRCQGALIDAYVLGSRRDLFSRSGIRINKIYDYSSAYGIVLTGEAKKLQKCFRKYVKENRKDIYKVIEENVHMIEEDEVSQSVQRARALIDPSSPVYKKCFTIIVVLLIAAVVLGCLFEFLQKPLKRYRPFGFLKYTTCDLDKLNKDRRNTFLVFQFELQQCVLKLKTALNNLKVKHRKELKQWVIYEKEFQRQRRKCMERTITKSKYYDRESSPSLELRKFTIRTDSRTQVYKYDPNDCETLV